MMHRPWSSIVEVPYCFSRSNVKFQGHTALKIVKFYRNWAFLDSNSSLNSLMVMKCCTKLETAKERCPIVFQSHPSNFKVTRDKTSPLLTRIGRFRTIGRSQLSNPSDLPCYPSAQIGLEGYCRHPAGGRAWPLHRYRSHGRSSYPIAVKLGRDEPWGRTSDEFVLGRRGSLIKRLTS